jgi:serine/tyrosine/threonine adenylyltransferase
MKNLVAVEFSNRFTNELPIETLQAPERIPQSRQVYNACSSLVYPTPVRKSSLVAWSEGLASSFRLQRPVPDSNDLEMLAGNFVPASMRPYAMCYGGHQFGNWAGQLGDGRAITLGEIGDSDGELWELQLKGSGPTPYSRSADGRAVLRSSIREFVASEAMFGLNVPTTRAVALVSTGDAVVRDMFYTGNARAEPGAIVARMSPTFLRFGSFEIFAARGDSTILRQLIFWTINRWFPDITVDPSSSLLIQNQAIGQFFKKVCQSTATLIAEWQRVGFVHGVMNTDNMSILGLTIDYGPFGWLDNFDLEWTPNTTDLPGRRYCFGRQPAAARWNLERLGKALLIALEGSGESSLVEEGLALYDSHLLTSLEVMWGKRLGIRNMSFKLHDSLFENLDALLRNNEIDMTLFFRGLSDVAFTEGSAIPERIVRSVYKETQKDEALKAISAWLTLYRAAALHEPWEHELRVNVMNRTNPLIVPRNFQLHTIIEECCNGEFSGLERLQNAMYTPYDNLPQVEEWDKARPEWARHTPGSSTLSCSS